MNVNLYIIEDYENETAFRPQKNKPKQTQLPVLTCRVSYTLWGAFLPLLQDLYIIYPLHSLPSIALAKEGQSKEKPAYKGDYD